MGTRLGEIPDPLAAATQAVRRLRSRLPQRLEYAQGILGGELGHRLVADRRAVVVAGLSAVAVLVRQLAEQRHRPLGPVLGVPPARGHALDQLPGGGVERHLTVGLGHHRSWISTFPHGLAAGVGQLPRVLERHIADRAKADGSLLAAALYHEYPCATVRAIYLQVQAAAVAMPPWPAGAQQRCYSSCREQMSRHVDAPPNPANVTPMSPLAGDWARGGRRRLEEKTAKTVESRDAIKGIGGWQRKVQRTPLPPYITDTTRFFIQRCLLAHSAADELGADCPRARSRKSSSKPTCTD
jgi:hypothetical protein